MSRKYLTIRRAMTAIAIVAATLGLISSERWRWGYPRHVYFNDGNALSWMATVIQSDFRKYDGGDVDLLMNHVARSGMLVGKTSEQVIDLLGATERYAVPPPVDSEGQVITYIVGTVPAHVRAGPPLLVCQFDEGGKCIKVSTQGSY